MLFHGPIGLQGALFQSSVKVLDGGPGISHFTIMDHKVKIGEMTKLP